MRVDSEEPLIRASPDHDEVTAMLDFAARLGYVSIRRGQGKGQLHRVGVLWPINGLISMYVRWRTTHSLPYNYIRPQSSMVSTRLT